MKTTRVLSIDWDFFVEEDPKLDWGHGESPIFLEAIWNIRRIKHSLDPATNTVTTEPVDLKQLLPFHGDELWLAGYPFRWNTYQIGIAESHLAILEFLDGASNLEIINVDAHHDIYYRGEAPKSLADADCGCWGAALMQTGRVKSWHQMYPDWRRKFPEGGLDETTAWARKFCKVQVSYGKPKINWRHADYVFICRSGCWTPPEYDERFNRLCTMFGAEKGLPQRSLQALGEPA